MKNLANNFIEIIGVSNYYPTSCVNFKQIQVQQKISLHNNNKPSIESILRVLANVNIKDYYVINTPSAISFDLKNLTEKKLIVRGELIIKIEYVSKDEFQTVHSTGFNIPFTNYIILNESFDIDSDININPYIEDIYLKQLNDRTILFSSLIILDAQNMVCI